MFTNRQRRRTPWALLPIIVGTIGLSGCANTLHLLASSQDSNIANPDALYGERNGARLQKSFTDEVFGTHPDRAWERGLRGSTAVSDCLGSNGITSTQESSGTYANAQRCTQPDGATSKGTGNTAAVNGTQPSTYGATLIASQAHVASPEAAKAYLESGIALSNLVCRDWFTRLDVAGTALNQTADTVSTLGSLTGAFMGVAGVASSAMGVTATSFGFTKSAIDNVDRNYIVAADLGAVRDAVVKYRANYAKEIEAADAKWNFYSATRVISAYESTCHAISVKRFIAKKLTVAGDPTGTTEIFQAASSRLISEAQTSLLNPPVLTDANLALIYAYSSGRGSAADQSVIQTQLIDAGYKDSSGKLSVFTKGTAADFNALVQKDGMALHLGQLADALVSNAHTKVQAQTSSETALQNDLDKFRALFTPQPASDAPLQATDIEYLYVFATVGAADRSKLDRANIPAWVLDGNSIKYAPHYPTDKDQAATQGAFVKLATDEGLKVYLDGFAQTAVKAATGAASGGGASHPTTGQIKTQSAAKADDTWPMPMTPDGRPLDLPPDVTTKN